MFAWSQAKILLSPFEMANGEKAMNKKRNTERKVKKKNSWVKVSFCFIFTSLSIYRHTSCLLLHTLFVA